jgi:ketopantoate hydroxymethyltransferase
MGPKTKLQNLVAHDIIDTSDNKPEVKRTYIDGVMTSESTIQKFRGCLEISGDIYPRNYPRYFQTNGWL